MRIRSNRAFGPTALFAPCRSQHCPHHHHRPRRHELHTTALLQQRKRSPYRSITFDELEQLKARRAQSFKAYDKSEKEELAKRYSPAQIAIIEAAEEAIPAEDLAIQGQPRRDVFVPENVSNWSRIDGGFTDKKLSRLRGEIPDYTNFKGAWTDETDVNTKLLPVKMARVLAGRAIKDEIAFFTNEDTGKSYYIFQNKERRNSPVPDDVFVNPAWARNVTDQDMLMVAEALKDTSQEDPSFESFDLGFGERELHLQVDLDYIDYFFKSHSGNPYIPPNTVGTGSAPSQRFPENNRKAIADIITLPTQEQVLNSDLWEAGKHGYPEVAPTLPKLHDDGFDFGAATGSNSNEGISLDLFTRIAKTTGLSLQDVRGLRMKQIHKRRVVNQTRLGKIASEYTMWVAGNERGMVGIGEGKAELLQVSNALALFNAVRNLKPVLRYEDRTIYGQVEGKVGAGHVRLTAAPPGFGLRASSVMFEIARAAGLQDLSVKSLRSRNRMNVAKATIEALHGQKDPEELAMGRGRKLVDARKVYYSGLV